MSKITTNRRELYLLLCSMSTLFSLRCDRKRMIATGQNKKIEIAMKDDTMRQMLRAVQAV